MLVELFGWLVDMLVSDLWVEQADLLVGMWVFQVLVELFDLLVDL